MAKNRCVLPPLRSNRWDLQHDTTEDLVALVEKRLFEDGLAHPGEHVVIMGCLPIASQVRMNFVRLHWVESFPYCRWTPSHSWRLEELKMSRAICMCMNIKTRS